MNSNLAVLYVEDHHVSRRIMSHLLIRRLGLQHVTIFEDSANLLQRAEAVDPSPDVILLDIHMTPLNGFEALEALRTSNKFQNTPIVALTASVMNEEVAALQAAGFDGCMSKPINSDTFEETLQRIIDGDDVWHIFS